MENIFTITTLIFVGATLLNVILQTIKSVMTVKGGKLTAAIMNAVAFGFYTVVIKSIVDIDLTIAVIVTVLGNLVGVWIALTILNKMKKDKLWRITATLKDLDSATVANALEEHGISHTVYVGDGVKVIDIYSKSQGESHLTREILQGKNVKYHVVEIEKTL